MKNARSWIVVVALPLGGCLVPASVFERASFPTVAPVEKPDYWQEQGRYRQEPPAGDPRAQATAPPTAAQQAGLEGPEGAPAAAPAQPAGPPLLGWDGGVVDGPKPGSVAQDDPARGLEPSPEGRMHIIELYQRVLDERDALAQENESLAKALENANAALEAERGKVADLEVRLAALEESHARSMEENRELAARLATAQIRRLEAEKLLLEAKLEEARARAAAEQAPVEAKAPERRGEKPARPAEKERE